MHLATIDPAEEITIPSQPKLATASARVVAKISIVIAIAAAIGSGFALWLRTQWVGHPDPRNWFNVFYFLFARNEPAGLAIVAVFTAVSLGWLWRSTSFRQSEIAPPSRLAIAVAAIGVFAIAANGKSLVFHDYLLTSDEYMADFQARIFLRGKIQAQVPAQYWDAVGVLKPTSADYFAETHSWNSPYLLSTPPCAQFFEASVFSRS